MERPYERYLPPAEARHPAARLAAAGPVARRLSYFPRWASLRWNGASPKRPSERRFPVARPLPLGPVERPPLTALPNPPARELRHWPSNRRTLGRLASLA